MKGYKISNGFINYSPGDFYCPYCEHHHTDEDEYYYHKMDSSPDQTAKVKCRNCRKSFKITYDYTGEVHGFK